MGRVQVQIIVVFEKSWGHRQIQWLNESHVLPVKIAPQCPVSH